MASVRARELAVAIVAGLVLAAVMTAPTITRPGSVARMDSNDGKYSVWNVAWVAHAILDSRDTVFDANIFYPHEDTLAYSEANLVAGVLAVPVYAATHNPVAAHNVVVYLVLVFAFVATWWLVRRLTGSAGAGVVAGAGFAFSPYVSAHTAHIQLLMVFVVPVALLALHRHVERPGPWRGAVLGASLAIAGLACAYYGIMTGLAVGLGALWFAPGQPRPLRYWAGMVVAVIVAAAVVAPALAPYVSLRRDTGFKSELNLDEARAYSADIPAYLRGHGGAFVRVLPAAVRARLDEAIGSNGEVLFPGLVMVGLAIAGLGRLRRRGAPAPTRDAATAAVPLPGAAAMSRAPAATAMPRTPAGAPRRVTGFYVVLAVVAAWASFGPAAGLYGLLGQVVPFMSFLRAPARFGVLVLFAIAVLAGWGVARLERRRGRAALAYGLTALVALELWVAWPLREVPPVPPAWRVLADLPRGGVLVLQFPYRQNDFHAHAGYMFWSMWSWQPLLNGYSDFIPDDFREMAVPVNGFPDAESFRLLRDHGARYVIVDWRTYNEQATPIMRARFPAWQAYLRPIVATGDVWLWEIVGWPAG